VDVTTAEETHPHDSHGATGHSDLVYVKVFVFLVVLTAAEVSLSYMHIGKAFVPILMVLMFLKFFTVVLYFMHLKYEKTAIFGRLFYTGLATATIVYVAALTTFKFWTE
jgi:cytochrome c oxidase subunit 4